MSDTASGNASAARRNRRAALCLPVIGKRGNKSNGEPESGAPECWPNTAAYPFAGTASRRRQVSHRIFAKSGGSFNKHILRYVVTLVFLPPRGVSPAGAKTMTSKKGPAKGAAPRRSRWELA